MPYNTVIENIRLNNFPCLALHFAEVLANLHEKTHANRVLFFVKVTSVVQICICKSNQYSTNLQLGNVSQRETTPLNALIAMIPKRDCHALIHYGKYLNK